MKKNLLLASMIIFAFSCSNNNEVEPQVQAEQASINATFNRTINESNSRTAFEDPSYNNKDGKTKWVVGDKIGVFTDTDEKNLLFTWDGTSFKGDAFSGNPQYAYYPRANTNAYTIANPVSLKIIGEQTQTIPDYEEFGKYDHRVGTFNNATKSFDFIPTLVILQFKGLSLVNLAPKVATTKSLTVKSVADEEGKEAVKINGSYKYDRTKPENPYYYVNNGTSSTTVTFSPELTTEDNNAAYVFVLPQIYGHKFDVILTSGESTFSFNIPYFGLISKKMSIKAMVRYEYKKSTEDDVLTKGGMRYYDLSKVNDKGVWFNFSDAHDGILGLLEKQKLLGHDYFAYADFDKDGVKTDYTKNQDGLDWIYLKYNEALITAVSNWLQ